MITLYTKPYCQYCERVKNRIGELAISYEEKSIESEDNLAELIEKGGKRQVPYLIDNERGVSMYETEDIIQYLESIHH
ncbi:MAG: glutathione S-transferase N-terminal domain-containing protein [Patescibacteria group bacterium]